MRFTWSNSSYQHGIAIEADSDKNYILWSNTKARTHFFTPFNASFDEVREAFLKEKYDPPALKDAFDYIERMKNPSVAVSPTTIQKAIRWLKRKWWDITDTFTHE